jgi:hypothetical protein
LNKKNLKKKRKIKIKKKMRLLLGLLQPSSHKPPPLSIFTFKLQPPSQNHYPTTTLPKPPFSNQNQTITQKTKIRSN